MSDDWPKGAVAMTKNLDLLTDEPLELAVALSKLADDKATEDRKDWLAFAASMAELVDDLKALNEPEVKTE